MSDYCQRTLGGITISGKAFEQKMQVESNPRVMNEEARERLLHDLYSVLMKHGFEGWIQVKYQKAYGTKVGT